MAIEPEAGALWKMENKVNLLYFSLWAYAYNKIRDKFTKITNEKRKFIM